MSLSPSPLLLLLLLLLSHATVALSSSSSGRVSVLLDTSWNRTSPLAEAAEYAAEDGGDASFFAFVDALEGVAAAGACGDDPVCVAAAASGLEGPSADVQRFAIESASLSPAAEVHRQALLDHAAREGLEGGALLACADAVAWDGWEGGAGLRCLDGAELGAPPDGAAPLPFDAFETDHARGERAAGLPALVLYAVLGSAAGRRAHAAASALAAGGRALYVLRPLSPPSDEPVQPIGFGVELAIKNMEYKVIDDRAAAGASDGDGGGGGGGSGGAPEQPVAGIDFARVRERRPELAGRLEELRTELAREEAEAAAEGVKVWDMKDLGLQAAARVLRADSPLVALQEVSQNFPMHANALIRRLVRPEMRGEIEHNRKLLRAGSNRMLVNGWEVPAARTDAFALARLLRAEADASARAAAAGLGAQQTRALLEVQPNLPAGSGSSAFRIDMRTGDALTDDGVILWLNDLEDPAETRYARWDGSVRSLLTPGWPNQLRYVRKNLHQGVIVIDASKRGGLDLFAKAVFFVNANAPMRVGVVFRDDEAASGGGGGGGGGGANAASAVPWDAELLPAAEWGEFAAGDGDAATGSFSAGGDKEDGAGEGEGDGLGGTIARAAFHLAKKDPSAAVKFLERLAAAGARPTAASAREAYGRSDKSWRVATRGGASRRFLDRSQAFVRRRALDAHHHTYFVTNGVRRTATAETFRERLMEGILGDQQALQMEVYNGKVTDATDLARYWSSRPDVFSRLSDVMLRPVAEHRHAPALPPASVPYAGSRSAALTFVVAADLAQPVGRALAWAAAERAARGGGGGEGGALPARVALLHNADGPPARAARAARAAAAAGDLDALRRVLVLAARVGSADRLRAALGRLGLGDLERSDASAAAAAEERAYCASALGLRAGESAVAVNGRVFAFPPSHDPSQLLDDVELAGDVAERQHAAREVWTIAGGEAADAAQVAAAASLVSLRAAAARRLGVGRGRALPERALQSAHTAIEAGDAEGSWCRVRASVDPVSEEAQRAAPVLRMLHERFGCGARVWLNPAKEVAELPLRRFFRYAAGPEDLPLDFGVISSRNVLTMGVDTPESWLVMARDAGMHDLDNLRLSALGASGLRAAYRLEHLQLAGQCFDSETGAPPAGLQLWLGSGRRPHETDTVVMQNLGYFQLKANPGVWSVRIAPGRASSIYAFDDSAPARSVAVRSFSDPYVRTRVTRREGMEREDLLLAESAGAGGGGEAAAAAAAAAGGGVWSSIFGGGGGGDGDGNEAAVAAPKRDERVHVMSVASGHLYERFLKIMMLSVVRSTKAPVKFWFISNFLSPTFKQFIPTMAARYGFEVELVSYRWPRWLRQQTEKQRLIWAYKILFLDVIFPLDLHRVIFVDADQVVRGDLRELMELDLNGAPYAYTPFCSSNTATEGFRFWKGGYWEQLLQGRPYHISALYVVDLDRFRRMRAGDSLRSIYDNLSADPNSLANLDQDLPNYAQAHGVPIFSLPQEWLWCETWCSMDGLAKAKSIDLCNNPLNKRPKLEVARELLGEWPGLDEEARALEEDWASGEANASLDEMVTVEI